MPQNEKDPESIAIPCFMEDGFKAFEKARNESKNETEFLYLIGPLLEEWVENTRINSTLEGICQCPIGMIHFFKFLQLECNSENLQAYIDSLSFASLVEKRTSTILDIKKERENFHNNYFDSNSTLEINISGKLIQKFTSIYELLDKLSDEEEALNSWKTKMCEEIFPEILDELLTNLSDPFSRFINSTLFTELCKWIYAEGFQDYRERLTQKKQQRLILNELIKWDKDLKTSSILLIVENALKYVTSIIQKKEYWKMNGNLDYEIVQKQCHSWMKLSEIVSQLQVVDLRTLNENEKRVFFMNIYNLLILHGAIESDGITNSITKRTIYFRETFYNIGGEYYSLEVILHGILRGNINYSNTISMNSDHKFISKNDPKNEFILPYKSPDLLFGLMTLTSVSPDFVIFDVNTFEKQLNEVKLKFIKQNVIINHNSKNVILPSIFTDFKKDFKLKNKKEDVSIKAYLEQIFNFNFKEYSLIETEMNFELCYFAYFEHKEDVEILKNRINFQKISSLNQMKQNQTLKQKVDIKLEQIEFGLVPLNEIEKMTSIQIYAWVLKFLSTQCGIEIFTTKKLFKTYENSFSTDTLISWFENQRITNRKKALKFIQKLHDICVIIIISGDSTIVDSSNQILQIQNEVLDHIEESSIYCGILKIEGVLSTTTYTAYLYPRALILTIRGIVMKVYRVGSFDSHCDCYSKKRDCYESIVQKCSYKNFYFVLLPYTIINFGTESTEELGKWLSAFSKIEGCSSFKDQFDEQKSFFYRSLQKIKILENKKQSSSESPDLENLKEIINQ
eukprot:gene2218-2392_t